MKRRATMPAMTHNHPVDPARSVCRIELHDGTTLSAATLPELARSWAAHVMGSDWWRDASDVERLGAASAMFQELARAFEVRE